MLISLRDKLGAIGKRLDLRPYLGREPVMLTLLFTVAVVLFLAVSGLSRMYHAQQKSLGNRWFARCAYAIWSTFGTANPRTFWSTSNLVSPRKKERETKLCAITQNAIYAIWPDGEEMARRDA